MLHLKAQHASIEINGISTLKAKANHYYWSTIAKKKKMIVHFNNVTTFKTYSLVSNGIEE